MFLKGKFCPSIKAYIRLSFSDFLSGSDALLVLVYGSIDPKFSYKIDKNEPKNTLLSRLLLIG